MIPTSNISSTSRTLLTSTLLLFPFSIFSHSFQTAPPEPQTGSNNSPLGTRVPRNPALLHLLRRNRRRTERDFQPLLCLSEMETPVLFVQSEELYGLCWGSGVGGLWVGWGSGQGEIVVGGRTGRLG